MAHKVDERIEQTQHPHHAKDVEHQVSHGSAPCLRIGTESRKVGCCSGSDVLSQHKGNAQIDGKHARRAQHDGDGHHGSRALHDASDDGAYQNKGDDGEMAVDIEAGKEPDGFWVVL